MSENTINAALKHLGYGKNLMTGHGFRAIARTILDEVLGVKVDFIEHQLAHAVKDPNGRAVNSATSKQNALQAPIDELAYGNMKTFLMPCKLVWITLQIA